MSVKLLYVLVSQSSDYYAEQAILSMLSAKYRMPEITISLLMDQSTKDGLEGFRKKVLELSDEQIVIQLDNQSSFIKSRILKTKMRSLVRDDFLYVDVDTIWADSINESDFTSDVMGVLDANCELEKHTLKGYVKNCFERLNYVPIYPNHVNGGVLYMKDSNAALQFSKEWNRLWEKSCLSGIKFDQPSLHQTIDAFRMEFQELPGYYNSQIAMNMNYFFNAKLIHYYRSEKSFDDGNYPYRFQQKSFWERIKLNGVDESVIYCVQNPKQCFDMFFQYQADDDGKILKQSLYQRIKILYKSKRRCSKIVISVLEKILYFVEKVFCLK